MKTVQQGGKTELCYLPGGLKITPWHPVKSEGTWKFPSEIAAPVMSQCEAVYTLVLDKDHIAEINGIQVIQLGHGYTEGVLKHEYFGT
jgi:hypothetical protein